MQCRSYVAQLGRLNEQLVKEGAQVLIILGDTLEKARAYSDQLKLPFPVLSDREREIYHVFELTRNFIGIQRTASIIVDKDGVIRYIKRATNPMTWLQESRELLEAIKF